MPVIATDKEGINQERAHEAQIDDQLAAGAEKAAQMIQERDQTINEQEKKIRDLESLASVVSEGSVARTQRISRKQKALEALRRTGVVVAILLAIALASYYPNPFASQKPAQIAASEAPPAGFLTRSAA